MEITAVIITLNEERNIGRCLASLQGVADEVVVVDSGSADATPRLCAEAADRHPSLHLRFVQHPWQGYDGQKNYANSLASHPWILSIDADEALSPALQECLVALKKRYADTPPEETEVFDMNRLNNHCGHWIRHSGWYPDRKTRLFHRDMAMWDGSVHEELRFARTVCHTLLDGDLLHYTYYSIADHAARQIRYATLAAEKAHSQGKRARKGDVWAKPAWTFFRNYILRLGILDGHAGFLVCRMSAFYTFLKYSILKELQK